MSVSGDVCGCYLCASDIDNWPSGTTEEEELALIQKVEQIIDKVTENKWCGTAFDLKLNGNDKNRLFIPVPYDILSVTSIFISCIELDSSWWTYDINSVFLDPCIGDSMWGANAVEDGDFYIWTVADPTTNLYYWVETIAGTSTINRDAAQVQVGNYCVRLDIDALESQAQIKQKMSLLRNRTYTLFFKYLNSEILKTAKYMLYNADKDESLLGDGTWAAGQVYVSLDNVVAWTNYSNEFTSHSDFANYELFFENDAAFSSSIYFDNVGILTAGIAAIASDIVDGIFPRGFNNIQVIGVYGESEVPLPIKQAAIMYAKWENDPSLYTYIGLKKSEKIGRYAYTSLLGGAEEILTGVMEVDQILIHYLKGKPILMAP